MTISNARITYDPPTAEVAFGLSDDLSLWASLFEGTLPPGGTSDLMVTIEWDGTRPESFATATDIIPGFPATPLTHASATSLIIEFDYAPAP